MTVEHRKKFNWENIKNVVEKSFFTSLIVYWLLIGGTAFAVALNRTGIADVVNETIVGMLLSTGMLVTLILFPALSIGMFLDAMAIIVITLPIFFHCSKRQVPISYLSELHTVLLPVMIVTENDRKSDYNVMEITFIPSRPMPVRFLKIQHKLALPDPQNISNRRTVYRQFLQAFPESYEIKYQNRHFGSVFSFEP